MHADPQEYCFAHKTLLLRADPIARTSLMGPVPYH
jgi:hypothetical protein